MHAKRRLTVTLAVLQISVLSASMTKNKQTVGLTDLSLNDMIRINWRLICINEIPRKSAD